MRAAPPQKLDRCRGGPALELEETTGVMQRPFVELLAMDGVAGDGASISAAAFSP
jgi:hypothetical protein